MHLLHSEELRDTSRRTRDFLFTPYTSTKLYYFDPTTKRSWCNKRAYAKDIEHAINKYSRNNSILGISRNALLPEKVIFLDFDAKILSSNKEKEKFYSGLKKLQILFKNKSYSYLSFSRGAHFYIKTNIKQIDIKKFKEFFKEKLMKSWLYFSSGEIISLIKSLDQVSTKFSSKQNIKLPYLKKSNRSINVNKRLNNIKEELNLSSFYNEDVFPPHKIKGSERQCDLIRSYMNETHHKGSNNIWAHEALVWFMDVVKNESIFKEIESYKTSEENKRAIYASIALSLNNSIGMLNNFYYFKNVYKKNIPEIHIRILKKELKDILHNGSLYKKVLKLINRAFVKRIKGNSYQKVSDLYEIRESFFINGNKKDNSYGKFIQASLLAIHESFPMRLKIYKKENNDIISEDISNKIRRLKHILNVPRHIVEIKDYSWIKEYVKMKVRNNIKKNKYNITYGKEELRKEKQYVKHKFSNKEYFNKLNESILEDILLIKKDLDKNIHKLKEESYLYSLRNKNILSLKDKSYKDKDNNLSLSLLSSSSLRNNSNVEDFNERRFYRDEVDEVLNC